MTNKKLSKIFELFCFVVSQTCYVSLMKFYSFKYHGLRDKTDWKKSIKEIFLASRF